jgi:hypothetical protein
MILNFRERRTKMRLPRLHYEPIDRNPFRVDEIFKKTPEISAEKLLESFAVDPETPLLAAVLHVLKGIEEIAKENASVCKMPDSERTFFAGGIAVAGEAQERIMDLVEKGNAAKRGRKEK